MRMLSILFCALFEEHKKRNFLYMCYGSGDFLWLWYLSWSSWKKHCFGFTLQSWIFHPFVKNNKYMMHTLQLNSFWNQWRAFHEHIGYRFTRNREETLETYYYIVVNDKTSRQRCTKSRALLLVSSGRRVLLHLFRCRVWGTSVGSLYLQRATFRRIYIFSFNSHHFAFQRAQCLLSMLRPYSLGLFFASGKWRFWGNIFDRVQIFLNQVIPNEIIRRFFRCLALFDCLVILWKKVYAEVFFHIY